MTLFSSAANRALALAACLGVLAAPMAAQAHRAWLAPAQTNFSGEDPWVTVDAAISNDLFYADHFPMNLEQVTAFGPDGAKLPLENSVKGRYRSTFDVHLTQAGTSRVVVANPGNVGGTYVVDGKTYRLGGQARRGPPPAAAGTPGAAPTPPPAPQAPPPGAQGGPQRPQILPGVAEPSLIPANATDIKIVQSASRNETFVTRGAPTTWKPTGVGLELIPGATHPNDVVADEPSTFKLTLDGKPAANAEVTVVAANQRFMNAPADIKLKTDASGAFTVKWPSPGFYWVNATAEGPGSIPNAVRRGSYTATLEVQKP